MSTKKYFRVIVKPIVLALLFFIIVISLYYLVYAPEPAVAIDPMMAQEEKQEEWARVQSFESWLTNLFQGNFGISSMTHRLVMVDLTWRLQASLLLIAISLAASISTGMSLMLVSMLWKKRKFKPLTFTHSLNGFFYGFTLIVCFLLIWIIRWVLYPSGIRLFILGRLHSIPVPTEPSEMIQDLLWHLSSPALALVLVHLIRNVVNIWSSGSLFASKDRYRNLLLPITTIDFSFTISATFMIEILFGIPGLFKVFLVSLDPAVSDYNMAVGALITILAIAIGLGFVSTILDLIRQLCSMGEELEKKIVPSSINKTSLLKAKWKWLKTKSFIIGSILVGFFLVLAAFAPFIATQDPYQTSVSGQFAIPEWMSIFQYSDLPRQTVHVLNWTVEQCPIGINATREGDKWLIHYNGSGTGGEPVSIIFNASFDYPYDPLDRYHFRFYWGASPEKILTRCRTFCVPELGMCYTICENPTANAQYMLEMLMTNPGNETYSLWDQEWYEQKEKIFEKGYKQFLTFSSENITEKLVHVGSAMRACALRQGYESHEAVKVAQMLFFHKGEYVFRMNITFKPGVYSTEKDGETVFEPVPPENATANAHITPCEFVIWGKTHGLMGTDAFGIDVFSQLIYGTRAAIFVAFPLALFAIVLGFPLGFAAGYFENWPDNIITTFVDALLSLPVLLFILFIVVLFGRQIWLIGLITLPFISALVTKAFRNTYLIRPSNQKLKTTTSRNPFLTVLKDIWGNFCLTIVSITLLLPLIDFLGFGDPYVPSWGRMLERAWTFGAFTKGAWWIWAFPMLFIALLALGFLLMGTSLDERRS